MAGFRAVDAYDLLSGRNVCRPQQVCSQAKLRGVQTWDMSHRDAQLSAWQEYKKRVGILRAALQGHLDAKELREHRCSNALLG